MAEPDFRKMGDPLDDRLPPRRQWLQAGAPNVPCNPAPTYGPHAAFIGWMVCTYNDVLGIWEDDWDGVIHEEPFTADTELASARSNGLNACLFELRRARTPADRPEMSSTAATTDQTVVDD